VSADSSGDTPRPADYASKADWIAYAVHKGASEEDAQAATKNELIELYG
jgi:acyl-CoA-binding protein